MYPREREDDRGHPLYERAKEAHARVLRLNQKDFSRLYGRATVLLAMMSFSGGLTPYRCGPLAEVVCDKSYEQALVRLERAIERVLAGRARKRKNNRNKRRIKAR